MLTKALSFIVTGLLLIILRVSYAQSCESSNSFFWCEYWYDTNQCWQNWAGNRYSCHSSQGYPAYYARNLYGCFDEYYYGRRTGCNYMNIYQPCHDFCDGCYSARTYGDCSSCVTNKYHWMDRRTCYYYCPRNSAMNGLGQYRSNSQTCQYCTDSYCSWCGYDSGGTCYTCQTSGTVAYLVDNQASCESQYSGQPGYTSFCVPDKDCYSPCPTQYYWEMSASTTTNSAYDGFTYGATYYYSQDYGLNTPIYYRRNHGNICYLCHSYCERCSNGPAHTQCSKCIQSKYKWYYDTQCDWYCPYGTYDGSRRGQWKSAAAYSNRACDLCNYNCLHCVGSAQKCKVCHTSSFLVDDKERCIDRFLGGNCTICNTLNSQASGSSNPVTGQTYKLGCQDRDEYCYDMNSRCPKYFYFQVWRGNSAGVGNNVDNSTWYKYGSTDARFTDFVNNRTTTSETETANYNYRSITNFCMLCDYRCTQCFGPSNLECTSCVNNFYKWKNFTYCETYCLEGQYQVIYATTPPNPANLLTNKRQCEYCHDYCYECNGTSTNCTVCKGINYQFDNPSGSPVAKNFPYASFLFKSSTYDSVCIKACPTSPNNLTDIGYYGSIKDQTCYPCPTPCSNCDINLLKNNYVATTFDCGSDSACKSGLICTSCLLGYSTVGGKCIKDANCRQYSYYLAGSSSSSWTPEKCQCLYGRYQNGYVTCKGRCDYRCKTCTGTTDSECLSCQFGHQLTSTTCRANQTLFTQYWQSGSTLPSGAFSASSYTYKTCTGSGYGSVYTLFGYQDVSNDRYFRIQKSSLFINFWATDIRMSMLFVDQWPQNSAVYIYDASNIQVWNWIYNVKEAYGQQLCGINSMDYLLTTKAHIPFVAGTNDLSDNDTAIDFYIRTNKNLFSNGASLYWGIKDVYVSILKCHTDCLTCDGPYQTDCIKCWDSSKKVVNGTCKCNTDINRYWNGTTCWNYDGCPAGQYKDVITATCVSAVGCSSPNQYGYPQTAAQGVGICVPDCTPYSQYATTIQMKCTTNCYALGQYAYKGSAWTCENTCPHGLIADPSSGNCVQVCPTNYFLKLQNRDTNPMCANPCPSGWQYKELQTCVTNCPNGYYKQTNSVNGRKQCVKQCTNSFGNNITFECVLSCPSPSYADSNSKLCVETCPDGWYHQIALSTGNRTCVQTRCEIGQFGNPFTMICSSDPFNCPVGYYADSPQRLCLANCSIPGLVAENSTRRCQSSCTTGFADWTNRVCVATCTANPVLWGFVANKSCVTGCSSSITGVSNLFADYQNNRQCVSTCSASPIETFGQNSSSLCVQKCTGATQYGDPSHPNRFCVTTCTSSVQLYAQAVSKRCIAVCPDYYFGQTTITAGRGTCSTFCPSGYWGNPLTHLCVVTCPANYFGNPKSGENRTCVQRCPQLYYGQNKTGNRVCVTQCDSGFWADNVTRMCTNVKTECYLGTYADVAKRLCVSPTNCTAGKYSDPFTQGCESGCSNTSYFGDSYTTSCVTLCSESPQQYSKDGYCVAATSCGTNWFADFQDSRKCTASCSRTPLALFGNPTTKKCVLPQGCPTNYYANNNTLTCVATCSGSLPYGDPNSRQCVLNCPDDFYGDSALNLCVSTCNPTTKHFADNTTGNCVTLCTLGTFGVNSSSDPRCQENCPSGSYARDSDRICMDNCGAGLYGDPITRKCYSNPMSCSEGYYANSVLNMCVLPASCQTVGTHYFAQNSTKTCIVKCDAPNYGDSRIWTCIAVCNQTHFGQNTTRLCLTGCSSYGSFAENQKNLCVATCSAQPISHYAQNSTYTCVIPDDCPTNMYASNATKQCVFFCPALSYADNYVTKRCLSVCPDRYYADDSTGNRLCVPNCPGTYRFRDNSTRSCVSVCPLVNSTFGDTVGDMCVYTCPNGYYAQQDSNRRCVPVCAAGSWGNQITRVCITNPLAECPPDTWADNFTNLCTSVCSASQAYFGNNLTKTCVTSCPSPSFAYEITRVCIDICPASLQNSGYFGDPSTSPTRKCFLTCQTAGLYRDVFASRTCKATCTFNDTYKTYKDPTTMSCQAVCSTYPQVLYAEDSSASCVASCSGGYRQNEATHSCVQTCPGLLDPTSNKCVDMCPRYSVTAKSLYADTTNKICVQDTNCPVGTYASDDLRQCVSTCPTNTYKYLTLCVSHCPHDFFIDFTNQQCVSPTNCPAAKFADSLTRSCVTADKCPGNFAQNTTKRCVDICSSNTYGDPFTHYCQTACSGGLQINTGNRSCVSECTTEFFKNPLNNSCSTTCPDPYFADEKTRACILVCSSNPMTFAETNSRTCTPNCPTGTWHDLVNRICVGVCPSGTYAYDVNRSCIAFCPQPNYYVLGSACVTNCSVQSKYSDDTTRTCVDNCPTNYFSDPTTFKCVINCPTSPSKYYTSTSLRACTTVCPEGTFADQQQGACVSACSHSPPMFAEDNNNVCVQSCPVAASSFADFTTYACVTTCPSTYFADSRNRTCVQNCSNFLFADLQKTPPACVDLCTLNTFADELTYTCVSTCPSGYFAHSPNRKCVQFCPRGYFADSVNKRCVTSCPAISPYADSLRHQCVTNCSEKQYKYLPTGFTSGGTCRYYCPNGFFANPNTMQCETSCPSGLFSQTTNNTCATTCQHDKFRDGINNMCVATCPSANNLFGDPYTRGCVLTCDANKFLYADTLTRMCEATCTGAQYADDTLQRCVSITGCSTGLYADAYYKKCVSICYNGTYGYSKRCVSTCPASDDLYADDSTTTCVAATSCPAGFFGDAFNRRCVAFCTIASGTYADNDTKKCLTNCNLPFYADNYTRRCVSVCPDKPPQLYGQNQTLKCVQRCPVGSFADPTNDLCVLTCTSGLYADITSLQCVAKCPQTYWGSDIDNTCVTTCPSNVNYFGEHQNRTCVDECPDGFFSDPLNNRQCWPTCSQTLFSENSTNQCLENCLTGYSNPRTQQCIAVCTTGYYGYNRICYTVCPTVTPTVFADDTTSLCVPQCPNGFYGDLSTLKCVQICPINQGYFAYDPDKTCVSECPGGYFADFSTRKCVQTCPIIPSLYAYSVTKQCVAACPFGLFANNATRSCVNACPDPTFADNSTMKCVSQCPSKPMMWGNTITNECVFYCSRVHDQYADNSTRECVSTCPESDNTFADPVTQTCVEYCPNLYFAVNSTRRCQLNCPSNQFADHLVRFCVAKCSVDPIFYGDPATWKCVAECPTNSFGNPLTQECVYNLASKSGCPAHHFSDHTTKLCVRKCPMKHDLYADILTARCEAACTGNQIADNSTMTCVTKCPQYPSYFADLDTMRCKPFCPDAHFAENITRICVDNCPTGSYAQNSTLRCLAKCFYQPLSFADPTKNRCVQICSEGYFADHSTLTCVLQCPASEQTFSQNVTNTCVKLCPNGTFGENSTRQCVAKCWGNSFGDDSSNRCVAVCPIYPRYYADSTTNNCVANCPVSYFAYQTLRTCVLSCPVTGLYRQNSTRQCVSSCKYSQNSYADNLTGFCVERCSVDTWADPTQRKCVSICPDQPLMYADNSTQKCVVSCPGNTFGQNTTRSCVNTCPPGSLSFDQRNLCVLYCPIQPIIYYAYEVTAFCVALCPDPYYGDPSTRSCVLECPMNQLLYSDNTTRTCVKVCPEGYYADKESQDCVTACPALSHPKRQTYAADYNNKCVEQCALPTFAYIPQLKCVNQCPNPYWNNVTDHICYLCPSVCTSCSSMTACTRCIANYFLQNGACVEQCSIGRYGNTTSMTCVSSLQCRPYFGVNSTNLCQSFCPTGQWKNVQNYRCDACPDTCTDCSSMTRCSSCITQSAFAENYCFGHCARNTLAIYYLEDNKTCVSVCPSGTYLYVIFCKPCNSTCTTCQGTASNCTLCSFGKYRQNGVCVNECSQGYKPNTSRDCLFCGNDCGQILNFGTNITKTNGSTNLFVNFNRNVNISGNLSEVFTVQKKSKRLLQQSWTNAQGYTFTMIDQKTIKITLPDGSELDGQYEVAILKPQNIADQFGNIPQNTRSSAQAILTDIYNNINSQNQVIYHSANYALFVAIIAILPFLFDIELLKLLQIIYLHYFVVMVLPPELSLLLSNLRYSTLFYLPTIYPIPSAVLRPNVPAKIFDAVGDYSFLRTAGFTFTPLLVVLLIWGLIKLLSIPQINRFKQFRMWCYQQLEEKFKFGFFLEFYGIFFTNTVFFIFLQMRDYTIYDTFSQASIILAHIVLLGMLVVMIYVFYRIISFYRQYPTLFENLGKASQLILQEGQYNKLNSSNIFLFEKKKVDLRNILYPKVNNDNILPFRNVYRFGILPLLCPLALCLRAIILSIIIGLLQTNTILQMSLAIPLNILMIYYFSKARPYSFKFKKYRIKNYLAIMNQVALVILEVLMLILGIMQRDGLGTTEKENFSYVIIYYLVILLTVNIIYSIFRTVVFIYRKMWLPFIESDMFKNNFPEKYAQYQEAKNKNKKLAKGLDPKAKQYIKSLIAGYKANKSSLRPNQEDKQHPQLPMKYKLTYFDRDASSVSGSQSSMSRAQRKRMLNELFGKEKYTPAEQQIYEEVNSDGVTEPQYQEYEQQIEIRAKDLSKYVSNAQQILRYKRNNN